jgi:branched-chain amino acid transport system ATP-binding protein
MMKLMGRKEVAVPSGTDLALELRGVTAGYGAATVLHDVSVAVPKGSVVALLGPNGAGKTTLLRTAGGTIRPSDGSVLLGQSDVTRRAPFERAKAGACLIPEGRGIFANLTVRENLAIQCGSTKSADYAAALDAFPDLRHKIDVRAGSLSGGQQQMVALSRCFTTGPEVVMLDEVSMGLAPLVIDQIFDALSLLAQSGVALLLVEQYVTRALAIADHVYLIDRGRITFGGPPDAIDEAELVQQYLHIETTLVSPSEEER